MQNPKSILDLQTKDNEIQVVQSRLTEITAQLSDESSVSDASKIDEAMQNHNSTNLTDIDSIFNTINETKKYIKDKLIL